VCYVRALASRSELQARTGGWKRRDVTVTAWWRKKAVIILSANCRLSLAAVVRQRKRAIGPVDTVYEPTESGKNYLSDKTLTL
jgi:hypothetical protein